MDPFSSFSTFVCGGCFSTQKADRVSRRSADVERIPPQNWGVQDVAQTNAKNLPFEFTAQQQLRDDSPEDALHLAAATGNLKWINEWEVLAQTQGAGFREICLNTQNPRTGMTPLHHAAAMGELATIKRLVDLGAEADAADTYGRTPLLIAKRCGHKEAFEWIRWRLYNTKRSHMDQTSIPGSSVGVARSAYMVPSNGTDSFKGSPGAGGYEGGGEPGMVGGMRRGMGEGVGLGRPSGATHVPISSPGQEDADSSGDGRVFHY